MLSSTTVLWKTKHVWIARQNVRVSRTHSHTHTEMTFWNGLSPNMSPTRTEIPRLLSERNTAPKIMSFYKCSSHPWIPAGMILVPHLLTRRYRYPDEQAGLGEDIKTQRRSSGGLGSGPGFLVWMVAQFRGIPSWVNWCCQFPGMSRRS